jgi:mannan endo-1,4-beta-mannosidase
MGANTTTQPGRDRGARRGPGSARPRGRLARALAAGAALTVGVALTAGVATGGGPVVPTVQRPTAVAIPLAGAVGPVGFVQRRGTELVQDGRVLAGTGVNLFDAAAGPGWACEHASTEDELTDAFAALRASGARVVRFWAFQTYTAGGTDWRGIDKVIAAAKASDVLLIPTLEDGPGWCTTGPTQQSKWQLPGYFSEGYQRPYGSAQLSLLDYAGVIAQRYRDERTIAAWMIMNEAETSERAADGSSALVGMARTVAAAIKRADPNHLVTLGTQGNGAPGTSGRDFAALAALPELDYTEVHDWPREGGSETTVLAGAAPGGLLPDPDSPACQDLTAPVACSFAIARRAGKPLVVGEIGVKTATAGGPAQRARAVGAKVRADLAAGAALVILWEARLPRDGGGEGFDVRPGSGDPLLEVLAAGAPLLPTDAAFPTADGSDRAPSSPSQDLPAGAPGGPPAGAPSATPTPHPATPAPVPAAAAAPRAAEAAPPAPRGPGRSAYVTVYTWWDNTPPGSPIISHPILHGRAGGSGTYDDPVTVAVGHDLSTGRDVLDLAAGTRVYLPSLRRYGIVEDTCGDGPTPQYGPCHNTAQARADTGRAVSIWLDVYGGGEGASSGQAAACADRLTHVEAGVLVAPPRGLPVDAGPLVRAGGCAALH